MTAPARKTTTKPPAKPKVEAEPSDDHTALLDQFPMVRANLSMLEAQKIPYEIVPQPPKVRVGHFLFDAALQHGPWRSDYDTPVLQGRTGLGVRTLIIAYREDARAIEQASQQDEEARAKAIQVGMAGYAAVEEEINRRSQVVTEPQG